MPRLPMIMKLTYKLTLAFLLVSLIAIGLAALFVWATTATEFNKYVADQRQAQFVSIATDYYRTHGNWRGVDTALREQNLLPPFAPPGSPPPDPQPYALVDQDRVVIIPAGEYQIGQKVQQGVLTKGAGVEISGLVVGTVLTTGQQPVRSAIEDKYLTSVNQSLFIAAVGGALIALILGLFVARTLTRPVRELTTATHALAHGDLQQRVPVRSRDELGELAQAFNQMSADLVRATQLRRQMTADIAHDLRTPLTVIGGYVEALRDQVLAPTPERFEMIYGEVQHLQQLVDDLRTLSLADAGELRLNRQPIEPRALLAEVAALFQHRADQQSLKLIVDAADNLPVLNIDEGRFVQVLSNLVSNALRYTPAGGHITLGAIDQSGAVQLIVRDDGAGIPPEALPHIFDRFYRADLARHQASGESGLGLAIARSIIEAHGGTIAVQSHVGHGTTFIIRL
jgi:two-component system sensor histidine kinase BaeS